MCIHPQGHVKCII
ncbi:rCG47998, partial [Rattus norvegicus]